MLWADVSYKDMDDIDNAQSIPDLERLFHVDIPEPMRAVLLELYVQTVLFCRRNGFNREQTSALLSIVKCMHQANTETPLNNMEQCFEYCSELLLCHSVRRPPFSVDLFKCQEGTLILEYINNTYIRNYALYKYIFTPQVRLDLLLSYGMSEQDDSSADNPTSPVGKESAEESHPAENCEPENTGPIEAAPGSASTLKAIIQQAVGKEVMRVSSQLEQRLKESTEQLNSKLTSLQLHPQPGQNIRD